MTAKPELIGTVYLDPERLRSDPVCVEIGANKGRFATAFLDRFGGSVIAYEPGIIAEQIPKRSGLTVCREAVWRTNGKVEFCHCRDQSQASSVHARKPRRGVADVVKVRCVSLEMALRKFAWVDVLNMDIEGAEWQVLSAVAMPHLRKVDQICIEFHTEFANGVTMDAVLGRLRDEAFFDVEIFDADSKRPIVYGVKRKMSPRKPHDAWLKKRFLAQRFETALNLGCGKDTDGRGEQYSEYLNADRVIRCDMEGFPGVGVISKAEHMPLGTDTFDLLFANWMLYKTDVPATLREIVRVCKPGATAAISYGHPDASYITAITETLRSLMHVSDEFGMDYVAKRVVHRAEAVFGTIRENAAEAFNFDPEPPVLVVVAHWDDEVISLGGTLQRIGKNCTIVSATHRDQEPTYRAIFDGVCGDLKAKPVTLDIRQREIPWDPKTMHRHTYTRKIHRVPLDVPTVRAALDAQVGDLSKFKTIITHCRNGDYRSHPQHAELANTLAEIFPPDANIWSFNGKAGTYCLTLTPAEQKAKRKLIRRYKPGMATDKIGGMECFLPLRRAGA